MSSSYLCFPWNLAPSTNHMLFLPHFNHFSIYRSVALVCSYMCNHHHHPCVICFKSLSLTRLLSPNPTNMLEFPSSLDKLIWGHAHAHTQNLTLYSFLFLTSSSWFCYWTSWKSSLPSMLLLTPFLNTLMTYSVHLFSPYPIWLLSSSLHWGQQWHSNWKGSNLISLAASLWLFLEAPSLGSVRLASCFSLLPASLNWLQLSHLLLSTGWP